MFDMGYRYTGCRVYTVPLGTVLKSADGKEEAVIDSHDVAVFDQDGCCYMTTVLFAKLFEKLEKNDA